MAEYLVIYYNGRGQREKVFPTRTEADDFMRSCTDPKPTLWKRIIDE